MVYILILLTGFLISLALTPLVSRFSLRFQIMDQPAMRKIHPDPVPTLGGVSIYIGFVVAILLGGMWEGFRLIGTESIMGIGLGGAVILCLGVYDDIRHSSAAIKLLFQALAAAIVFRFGFRITSIANPFGGSFELSYFSLPVTVLWVMVFVNAVNLIDGIDGLATGIAAIASVTFILTGLNLGNPEASLFALAMLGATLGFLRYNLFPATIFMGDTGSMFIGFSLAAIAMLGAGKSVAVVALLIPILAIGVPLLDTLLAIFRRSKSRHGIFNADRSHIHHKLLDLGFSARQTVLILWVAAILLSIVAVALSTADRGVIIVFVGFAIASLTIMGVGLRIKKGNGNSYSR